jgi:hypothetical protein
MQTMASQAPLRDSIGKDLLRDLDRELKKAVAFLKGLYELFWAQSSSDFSVGS